MPHQAHVRNVDLIERILNFFVDPRSFNVMKHFERLTHREN